MNSTEILRIEAAHKTVAEVFSDTYSFDIPHYQRPYAWEALQVQELLSDLTEASHEESKSEGFYFLGSVVLVKRHGDPNALVIDGQQRLTTLTILFSVIRDLSDEAVTRARRDQYIKQLADEDIGLVEKLRLRLRAQDQDFFERHIQRMGATGDLPTSKMLDGSQLRIVENAEIIFKLLSDMTSEERNTLLRFLLQNCYLVVVEVPTAKAARRIFTVLNARGLDLTATDILKAEFLEHAEDKTEKSLSKKWEEIEDALGREKFSDLFTHIRMIYERDKPRSALEVGFPQHVAEFNKPTQFMEDVLEPYFEAYILSTNTEALTKRYGTKTAALIASMARLDNKDWLPPLLLTLRKSLDGEEIDVEEFAFNLERLSYFLFITRADVTTRMSRFSDVLDILEPLADSKPRASRKERSTGLEITENEARRLFESLDGEIYLSSRVVKPVLLRLELASKEKIAGYGDPPTVSVEHVCPQTINANSQWAEWYEDSKFHSEWVHSLGNLVLLDRRKNSTASNHDFDEKKRTYFASGDSSPFVITNEVREYGTWTPDDLKARQKEVLKRFADDWELKEGLASYWHE